MLYFKILILLFYINLYFCSIIDNNGDSIFGYFCDLVYDKRNYTGQFEFVSVNNECMEWQVLVDTNRMMVFESKLSNNLVISFKGTQSLKDIFSDINFIEIDCKITKKCGKIHMGFLKEYNDISDHLNQVMKSIDQPYNIYFTGHSLGGTLAVLATLEYSTKLTLLNTIKNIKSLHCITFGQPALGNREFSDFMKENLNKFTYRRYVNMNNHSNGIIDLDPIPTSYTHHPNDPILLNCNSKTYNRCPALKIGLHFLDLYNGNIYNPKYASCNTNCKYIEPNAKFFKYKYYHCPISSKSIVHGEFNPHGILPDKYSVCLFTSKKQFQNYSYRNSKSCHLRKDYLMSKDTIIINKIESKRTFELNTYGEDLYIVVENHNTILPTSSFSYNISFSNPVGTPYPPSNLTCKLLYENSQNNTMDISIQFNSNNDHLLSPTLINDKKISYNIYISEINKDWKKYEIIESISLKSINKTINNIPSSIYSIVVTADNGFESHPSNYEIIYCKNCKNDQIKFI